MIQFFHVYKNYGVDRPVLHDINVHLAKGELAYLTGASGAGKSTLLKLLFAEEAPSRGQLLVGGINVSRIKRREIPQLRRRVGVVFQDFKLLAKRTVEENVALTLQVLGLGQDDVKRRVFQILKQVGLGHKRHAYPLSLSGGEQQRVAIARALVNEPQLLLCDEPTGSLDRERADEIMSLLHHANSRGTTMLIATHDPNLYNDAAGRVFHLDAGRLEERRRL